MKSHDLIARAKNSSFYLWLLNRMTSYMVPFNKHHGFRIIEIRDHSLKTCLPYKKRNFNHIKGLHATALATLAEFTSGFLLLSRIDAAKYRIILQKLEVEYFYQRKTDAVGYFEIDDQWLKDHIYDPLAELPATVVQCPVRIMDTKGNHLATGISHWQVKNWKNVKTEL